MRMEVRLFPNSSRPGVGLKPRREGQRPLLPQHARHCPVLEAGSALGFLVHPPLNENESFHIEYHGEGRYRFVYSVNPTGARWEPIFSVAWVLPVGGIGAAREEITLRDGTEEEMEARRRSREAFSREKAAVKLKTPYGLEYSPHYLRTSRLQNATAGPHGAEAVTETDTTSQSVPGEPPKPLGL